jgi:hypothetical protein
MNTYTKRFLLFLIACIGIRSLFVYIASEINPAYLPYLGYLALLPAIGFISIYVTGSRTTGPEVFGERIWWNHLRPIHSALYFLFAYSAIRNDRNAWVWLLLDVLIGLLSFLIYHYQSGHFSQISFY